MHKRECVCTCVYVYKDIHIYLFIYTCTYTYTHGQSGQTSLHKACEMGCFEVVKYLCEQGGKKLLHITDKVRMCRTWSVVLMHWDAVPCVALKCVDESV
jgi:hypothetical protein